MGMLTFQMTKRHNRPPQEVEQATVFVQVDFAVLEDVAGSIVEGRELETMFKRIRPALERIARTKMNERGADATELIKITLRDLE